MLLEQLQEESNAQALDEIPLEKIHQRVIAREGAEIVAMTRLTVVNGFEAKITVVDNDDHKLKQPDGENVENTHRETEVSITVEVERHKGNKLATRFTYDRTVIAEEYVMNEEAENEEAIEQKFSLSNGMVLQARKMSVAGAHINGQMAAVLLIKADL